MSACGTVSGRCLCGGVQFSILSPLTELQVCHCRECQRAQGSAFASNAPVKSLDVRFDSGAQLLKRYESSPGKVRVFCSECGSPIYSQLERTPETLRVRVGLLNDLPEMVIHSQAWCVETAQWLESIDDAARYVLGRSEKD